MVPALGSSKPAIMRSTVVLPGAGGSEQGQELPVEHIQGDVGDRVDRSVACAETLANMAQRNGHRYTRISVCVVRHIFLTLSSARPSPDNCLLLGTR